MVVKNNKNTMPFLSNLRYTDIKYIINDFSLDILYEI